MVFKKFLAKRLNNKAKKEKEAAQQQEEQEASTAQQAFATVPQHDHHRVQGGVQRIIEKINFNVKYLSSPIMSDDHGEDLALFHRDEIVIGKKLGSGGFSDVYEIESFEFRAAAENESDDSYSLYQTLAREYLATACANGEAQYALKHLRPKMLKNPRKFCMAAADLVIEAKFLTDFNHPHILGIRGWATGGTECYRDSSHDGYFLIIERLYETLEQRMERWTKEGISDDDLLFECTRIGTQIASALEYLHSKNIIYRDLKPNNIGFDANDDIKIFDLGLCRELPSKEATTDVVFKMSGKVGTLRYMSPECAMSEVYGVSSDVYSFAMVFYEMMNRGHKPFAGYSRLDHAEKACRAGERPMMSESWPVMIQDLLERGWSPNIEERPTIAEMAFRLQDILMDLIDGRENDRKVVLRDSVSASFPSSTKLVGEDRTGSVSSFSEHEASVEL